MKQETEEQWRKDKERKKEQVEIKPIILLLCH